MWQNWGTDFWDKVSSILGWTCTNRAFLMKCRIFVSTYIGYFTGIMGSCLPGEQRASWEIRALLGMYIGLFWGNVGLFWVCIQDFFEKYVYRESSARAGKTIGSFQYEYIALSRKYRALLGMYTGLFWETSLPREQRASLGNNRLFSVWI